jgi:serine/threonine-protein kinase
MDGIPERLAKALADRYRLEREIGAGGAATVYLADDLKHDRRVAIKVLRPEVAEALGPSRFEDEIRIAARLQHPHILPVHDSGEAEGYLYYVMPYVEGLSLRERIQAPGPRMTPSQVARVLAQVADALGFAHAAGFVHRDIKPENIMLAGRHALVTDFGVAKAISDAGGGRRSSTSQGLALGTPAYMAPEQCTADPELDHRADLYALGIVGYELLAGHPPFGGSAQEILAAHTVKAPEPLGALRPDIAPALERLVMQALAKSPDERWQTAEQMHAQLEPLTGTSSNGITPTVAVPAAVSAPPRVTTPANAVTPAMTPAAPRRTTRALRWVLGIVGVLVLVGLAIGWSFWHGQPGVAPSVASPATSATPAAAGAATAVVEGIPDLAKDPSIAVLPFQNMSSDPEQAYFSDGIAEELLNLLARVPRLRVIARTSSFAYKDKDVGIAQIARELHVATVLEGSVRKSGDTVRITVQLIRASDGTHLWSETYDRKLDDIFKVQDEIAAAVVGKLRGTLLGDAVAPTARPVDPRVYPHILRANALLNTTAKEARAEATKILEAVVALNPDEPRAWLGLSRAYVNEAGTNVDERPRLYKQSREAAEKALSLDPGLGLAETYLGRLDVLEDRDLQSAADHYARALALEPNNPGVLANATAMLGTLGRPDDVLAIRRWLVDHDPANPLTQVNYCKTLVYAGDYAVAVPACESAGTLAPDAEELHSYLSDAYLNTDRAPEALKQAMLVPEGIDRNVQLALVYHALGRGKDADAALATFKDNPDYTGEVATVAAYRGDADTAFAYLRKTFEANPTSAKGLVQNAYLKRLDKDPRWLPFLRRMGVDPETLGKIRFRMTLPATATAAN